MGDHTGKKSQLWKLSSRLLSRCVLPTLLLNIERGKDLWTVYILSVNNLVLLFPKIL